jgi:hypothetical protein
LLLTELVLLSMKELMITTTTTLAAENVLRLNLGWLD